MGGIYRKDASVTAQTFTNSIHIVQKASDCNSFPFRIVILLDATCNWLIFGGPILQGPFWKILQLPSTCLKLLTLLLAAEPSQWVWPWISRISLPPLLHRFLLHPQPLLQHRTEMKWVDRMINCKHSMDLITTILMITTNPCF